jgi:hypothetical protein
MLLFRFRVQPPHWAAYTGWIAGVANPYWDNEEVPASAPGTFSELTPFESLTEQERVDHLRQAMSKRGLFVPS